MLVATNCTECGAEQRVDLSFAGTRRTCEACGQRFLFEVPEEQAAQIAAAARAEARRPGVPKLERLGCARCMASYNKKLKGHEKQVSCMRCGQVEAVENARELGGRLDALERDMWDAVQHGDEARAVAVLQQAGLDGFKSRERVANAVTMLPFVRSEWQFSPPDAHPTLAVPPWCDACTLTRPLRPCTVVWRAESGGFEDLTASTGSSLVSSFLMNEMGMSGSIYSSDSNTTAGGTERMEGLYFLCADCERRGKKAFSGYSKFPAGSGMYVHDVKAVMLRG